MVFPFHLIFDSPKKDVIPSEKVFDASGEQVMFYTQLIDAFEIGDIVLEVYAPSDPLTSIALEDSVKIADINLLTKLQTSTFGDERLFFQHKNFNHDF